MKELKNQNLYHRFIFAIQGLKWAFMGERSFRTQIYLTIPAIAIVAYLGASAEWWAIITLLIGSTLAMELMNTALEFLMDEVRPEFNVMIGKAKDCAAAAVFLLSIASLIIFVCFLSTKF